MKNLYNCTIANLFFVIFFLFQPFQITNISDAQAEIVDIQIEEKIFGDWKVFCETDVMMDISHCKIAAKFYENSAAISIEPTSKFFSQFFIIIPQIKLGSFVKIRIDQNDLILSQNINVKDFGLIPIDETQKQNLFQQMKAGDFLYLRFSLRASEKEITAKINLRDFRNALVYYNSRVLRQPQSTK
jgi:hypothetical protein